MFILLARKTPFNTCRGVTFAGAVFLDVLFYVFIELVLHFKFNVCYSNVYFAIKLLFLKKYTTTFVKSVRNMVEFAVFKYHDLVKSLMLVELERYFLFFCHIYVQIKLFSMSFAVFVRFWRHQLSSFCRRSSLSPFLSFSRHHIFAWLVFFF